MESALIISASIFCANSMANFDFPTAVGPKIAMILGIIELFSKVIVNY